MVGPPPMRIATLQASSISSDVAPRSMAVLTCLRRHGSQRIAADIPITIRLLVLALKDPSFVTALCKAIFQGGHQDYETLFGSPSVSLFFRSALSATPNIPAQKEESPLFTPSGLALLSTRVTILQDRLLRTKSHRSKRV